MTSSAWSLFRGPAVVAMGLALAWGSLSSAALAFRTGADTGDFGETKKVRWKVDRIDYRIVHGVPANLSQKDVESALQAAFAAWSEPACSGVELAYDSTTNNAARPDDGFNSVAFVDEGWRDLGFSKDAAGVTDLLYEEEREGVWRIVEGDIYFNAEDHTWAIQGGAEARDVLAVGVHEAGHLLGLLHPCEPDGEGDAPDCADHPDFDTTTMYPFYDAAQSSLGDDDIAGVCFLYSGKACGEAGCGAGMVCEPEGCLAECGDEVCAPGERCGVEGCQPLDKCSGKGCTECESASDCEPGETCTLAGYCGGPLEPGDPCASDNDCAGGLCNLDGFCIEICERDSDCQLGFTCAAAAPELGQCQSDKKPLGEKCESPEECVGGLCLAGATDSPICSRSCGREHAFCPSGWDCEDVGGEAACSPLEGAPDSANCAVTIPGARKGRTAGLWPLSLLALGGAFVRRMRRRRDGLGSVRKLTGSLEARRDPRKGRQRYSHDQT